MHLSVEKQQMKTKMKQIAVVIALIISVPLIAGFQSTNLQSKDIFAPIRVACVGDSITAITGYPSDLQLLLGTNYSVGNFGAYGSTVLLNSWKPYMDQPQFQSAMDFRPNIVFIMLGTNDDLQGLRQYNESFEDDYTKLIVSFQSLDSKPQIWIMTPPPIFNNSSDLSNEYLAETLVPHIENLTSSLNLPTININSDFGNHAEYFVDGVHPNSQGASLIASEAYKAINNLQNSIA
jgi:acyl-CoA thioesterase-1